MLFLRAPGSPEPVALQGLAPPANIPPQGSRLDSVTPGVVTRQLGWPIMTLGTHDQ
jgi:hypothetical protein